jgi:hypothetical protein
MHHIQHGESEKTPAAVPVGLTLRSLGLRTFHLRRHLSHILRCTFSAQSHILPGRIQSHILPSRMQKHILPSRIQNHILRCCLIPGKERLDF